MTADLGLATGNRPRLRIAVNADSLAAWLLPALADLPGMLFDIVVDDQDHSADFLRRCEVAAAVTAEAAPAQSCDAASPDDPLDTPLVWQSGRIGRAGLTPLAAAVRRAAEGTPVPP